MEKRTRATAEAGLWLSRRLDDGGGFQPAWLESVADDTATAVRTYIASARGAVFWVANRSAMVGYVTRRRPRRRAADPRLNGRQPPMGTER